MSAKSAATAAALLKKRALVSAQVDGRASANSASLARSFDLDIKEVRSILQGKGVKDDG